ncbi:response regulator [Spirosoma linguale]|uniref:Response regulatory domain-containing protein n=1 Tax=Spirosoma linguale (strain ATCC 33905 / DSM 74 / LMG 10896 / Claus 1) TaxID=504472 RepID=D2QHG2_SPILD|nr:response regulator receiver and unknown domain protein [Spirosoma linguale DSM 74]
MPDDQRRNQKASFPLLVAVANKDHQLLIQYSLLASMPQAMASFAATADEAIVYLAKGNSKEPFPRLVLLDVHLPTLQVGYELVKHIKHTYPCLPIVAISSDPDADIVKQAYEFGVHSFLIKPVYLEEWEHYFRVFNAYWSGVVTLPPSM